MAKPSGDPACDPARDLAGIVARFAGVLHSAGVPVGPDRAERFARAVTVASPRSVPELRALAHATLAFHHAQDAVLDRVFDAVFGGFLDPADSRGDQNVPLTEALARASTQIPPRYRNVSAGAPPAGADPSTGDSGSRSEKARDDEGQEIEIPSAGSELERLHHREFSQLTPDELMLLANRMADLRLATPIRPSRRMRRAAGGRRIDLRSSLRLAHRSGGDPLRLVRRKRRERPRRLVVLCDISGSMEPYARAMLQLLYCAAGAADAEVFTFATRLTRLTPILARTLPGPALARAGESAPDWSGGTRIGAALQEFLDRYGRAGMARGAVVMVISDGWETGDPTLLGQQMERLSRLAHRIVWVNPRTQSPKYRPLVGGMAAAWPFCDAVVSAHRMDALDDLVDALAEPGRRR
jgi:uncharacterized protein with von Willebrand factor type A (vWA) domain